MATITKLPILPKVVNTDSETTAILAKVNSLKSRFGVSVTKVAILTGLADYHWLIYSIMYRENGDGNTLFIKSTGATGLLQVTPDTASDVVIRENQKNRITTEEKAFLNSKLGTARTTQILKRKQLGNPVLITTKDLQDVELNLYFGCLYIAQLVDECTENGSLRLDKLITRYLRYYSKPTGATPEAVITWVKSQAWSSSAKTENVKYIEEVGGRNGIAHIIA